ncbi:restriction endonuclease [Marinospirillum minutulum]|uniref:restriction endonuclease n=1 Tax=Marinospirillum minutulum TaxID=64974 RepID=UPI00041E8CE7|nr:restriction endonuclease [Marinospirillum minutulum]
MKPQVFAFAKVDNDSARAMVYAEIMKGKSRFGMWDQETSLINEYHGGNGFLLKIKAGDWIVHVNSPKYGHCVAVQATGTYQYDEGLKCSWGIDFCNFIPINPETIVEFDRNDERILPSVNLRPMRRGQRVKQVEDFLQSLENLKCKNTEILEGELRGVLHLRAKFNTDLLPKITKYIHELNRSKELEKLLHSVFNSIPNVESTMNGFGWKSDHGADLIVEFLNPLSCLSLSSKLIVQVKSYAGEHTELTAINQIAEGIDKYYGDGGLLITTGNTSEQLEEYAHLVSERLGKPIDIIAGVEVSRFILRHAPSLIIGLGSK